MPPFLSCHECGKRLYLSRKHAKQAAKETVRKARGGALREYRCPAGRDGWHIGHLADSVRRGVHAAGSFYGHRSTA